MISLFFGLQKKVTTWRFDAEKLISVIMLILNMLQTVRL